MTDDSAEATPPEAVRVAQALLAVLGDAHGIDRLPGAEPDAPEVMLPDPSASLALLAQTSLLSGPAKLQVLAQVVHAGRQDAQPIAESLVRTDIDDVPTRNQHASALLSRLADWQPGNEPLDRSSVTLRDPDTLVQKLAEDVQAFAVTFELPDCDTDVVKVDSQPTLSIRTKAFSTQPLDAFVEIVEPRNWPSCEVQGVFFRSMDPVPPLPPPPPLPRLPSIDAPDNGWNAILREVVDFSFGFGWAPFTTDLKFVYFADESRVGCTYDRHASVGNRITVDQGYLLVEDLENRDVRRMTTLKQVHFSAGDVPPWIVCPVWSVATMVIGWACMGKK